MKSMPASVAVLLLALAALVVPASAADADQNWPHWRGPLANGIAPQGDPPLTWSETENVKWKVACPGGGSASPIVWGDKIFVLAAEPADRTAVAERAPTGRPAAPPPEDAPRPRPGQFRGPGRFPGGAGGPGGFGGPGRGGMSAARPTAPYRFEVLCFARATGNLLWRQTAREEVPHEAHHQADGGFACYSPVTDGERLYAYFGSRGLYCFDLEGSRKWERELSKMNIIMQFGEGGSPALHGDTLIVNRDHEGDSEIVALNKHTGETIWQLPRDEGTSWSTPLVLEHAGQVQVIVSATNRVRSYDIATGKVLWECSGQTRNVIPSPVTGLGMVFATSGFRGSACQAIELGHTGDLSDSDAVRWTVNRGTPYVPSPLLYGDNLYLFSGNNAILSCYDAKTGAARFTERRFGALSGVYASPVGAADRVYLLGRNGKAAVIRNAAELEILAENSLDEAFDASPAIAGNEMFLRGKSHLYCLAQE